METAMTDNSLENRLDRIDRILRENELHGPGCPVLMVRSHNNKGQTYMYPQPCNCWLSDVVE